MQKPNNTFDIVAIGSNFNKPKVYYHQMSPSSSSMEIGTAFSSCDKVIIDIKTINSPYVSENKNLSKESFRYSIDSTNPFDIILLSPSSPVSVPFIKGLISYNNRKNIIEINTRAIFSKGFFPFSLSLNFSADGFTRAKDIMQKPIIKVEPNQTAGRLFDGLSLRVKNDNTPGSALIIDEFKKFSQNRMFDFRKTESFGCERMNVKYEASGNYYFTDNGKFSGLSIENTAEVNLLPGFPLISVSDRFYSPYLKSSLKYKYNNPRLFTSISHKQYLTKDGVGFFDQTIVRSLRDEGLHSRNHPLISLRDPFSSIKTRENVPVLHFRREYGKKESPNTGKVPYNIYLFPDSVLPTESYVSCIDFNIAKSIALNSKFEIKIVKREKNNIRLESKFTYNGDGSLKVYYGVLDIKIDESNSTSFGKCEVFHSDNDVPYIDVATRGITVFDIFNALTANMGGQVSSEFPEGSGSQTHLGFVPTFKDLGIYSSDENSPVISFKKAKGMDACELIAAARMYLGNKENSLDEKSSIKIEGIGSTASLFCRGLKNFVKLDNYICIAPLNRCLTTPFVRGEIKSFSDHLKDGDFLPLEEGGNGYNIFYKYDTIEKSINIMKYGNSYFSGMLNLPEEEREAMLASGPASSSKYFGEPRKLFGASQIGLELKMLGKDSDESFFAETPSYIMSHFAYEVENNYESAKLSKTFENIPSNDLSLFIFYKNSSMFPGPYYYGDSSYVPDPVAFNISKYGEDENKFYGGGVFRSLYTTSGLGSHLSNIDDIKSSQSANYYLSLNPLQFDNNALLIYEGGDELEKKKRFVNINSCNQWIYNSPQKERIVSAFIRKDMIDWAKERGWTSGKAASVRFITENSNNNMGIVYITGSGIKSIKSYLNYDDVSKSVTFATNMGTNKYIGNKVSDFKNAHDEVFSGVLDTVLHPNISPTADLPYEKLIFNKVFDEFPDFIPISNFDVYEYISPYYAGSTSSYGSVIVDEENLIFNSYEYFNPYFSPYEISERIDKKYFNVYRNVVNSQQETKLNFYIDYLNENKYPRSYNFYLKNPKYRSIKDLVDDINNSLGQYGIIASSLVENPEAYSVSRLVSKDPANILEAYYEFEKVVVSPENPYLPFPFSFDSYGAYDSLPYFASSTIPSVAQAGPPSEENESGESSEVLVFPSFSADGYFDGYIYDLVYNYSPPVVEDFINNFTPIISSGEVQKVEAETISYERVRKFDLFDSSININYDVYHEQGPESQKLNLNFVAKSGSFLPVGAIASVKDRPRDAINLPKISNDNSYTQTNSFASSMIEESFIESSYVEEKPSQGTVFKSYKLASSFSGPVIQSMQIAYGGQYDLNGVKINASPNSYFSNSEQSGIGQIEFRTVDAQFAIVLVKLMQIDGRFVPSNSGATEIFESVKARVYYSSTESPEEVVGTMAPDQCIEFVSSEESLDGSEYYVYPINLKIPIKAVLNFVNITIDGTSLSSSVKILNAPSELDNFGFLAINNNNPNYNMKSSREGKSFGLVLDNFGNYDILISPEASMEMVPSGDFNFSGKGFTRTIDGSDDTYFAGIGAPLIDPENNDINGFDQSSILEEYRSSLSILPVPGYPQVWVLRISPSLRAKMVARRRATPAGSLDNCYVDVPIYFQGNTTESAGTCNVRIFVSVKCVFDYDFCDFFWNLGSPLSPPPAYSVPNALEVNSEEWIDCENNAIIINENGIQKTEITSYFMIKLSSIPMLDNGTALMLIKSDISGSNIRSIFNPPYSVMSQLKNRNAINTERPWEFECSFLTLNQLDRINKNVLYTNPQDYSQYDSSPASIASKINSLDKFMLIQPKFKFPYVDEIGRSSQNEVIIASIGFVFKDWKPASTEYWEDRIMLGIKFVVPSGQVQQNLFQNFSIRYLYNEDRKLK